MRKLSLVFLAGLMLVSTAFAGGDSDSGTATPAADEPSVLTVLLNSSDGWVRNFNPFVNNAYQFTLGFTHEYLVIYDPLNNNREIMWLAEDIVSEADNKTLTVKLRSGIKWSDGEDFTAEDVAYTYEIGKDHPALDTAGNWGENGKIEAINIIDDLTLEIVMREPNRFHRADVFNEVAIIPEHIWSEVDDPKTYIYENPVVTGPFSEVVSFAPEMIVLGRNPLYWKGDELAVDQLRIPQFNGNDGALALLESGQVDWAHIFIPDADTTYVQGDPNRKFWYGKNDGVRIAPNYMSKNEGFVEAISYPEFKYALSMATDRQGIIDSAVFGYLDPAVPPNTGLPTALWGFRNEEADAITQRYSRFDIDAAKDLLAEAGFVDVDGDGFVETPSGLPIEFDILSPAGWSDWNDGAQIASEGMREAGVNATARAVDLGIIIDSWETNNHDMLYAGYGLSANIYKFYFDTLGDQSRVLTPTWWSITQTNYASDEMTALVNQMPSASDAELKAITDQIEMHYAENMVNIPMFYNGLWFVYNDSRFTGWSTEANPFVNPALADNDTKLYQLLQLRPVQ